ncbi:MAG TPA: hypothetical protein VFX96_11935 [Pyrinomonadaceae bacterium]|nr:hypothetical protein [Pyrinomonadaceae bacterium]
MMNNRAAANGENVEKRLRTMRILWAVFLWNVFLFVLLVYVAADDERAESGAGPAPEGIPTLLAVLFAIGLASVALSFVLKPRYFRQAVDEQKPEHVQTGLIVALVLCEVAALLGVVAMFVIGHRYGYLLFALAAVGQMLHYPRREQLLAASYKT